MEHDAPRVTARQRVATPDEDPHDPVAALRGDLACPAGEIRPIGPRNVHGGHRPVEAVEMGVQLEEVAPVAPDRLEHAVAAHDERVGDGHTVGRDTVDQRRHRGDHGL